ncbi:MAG TPA: hypothetical protein VHL31_00170 [Geminicoccus sp.]|uniref:hypothetical protein n=1 Tax=Geminicoccus sp. TaxID=2024832 RepID=UPI002E33D88C|nr:hypothetical protein [Geminicoccus sp.]HEX2524708.1 hypothetical protein [Geminicoccus sp.]
MTCRLRLGKTSVGVQTQAKGAGARQMSPMDAAKARLDKALARLTEEVTANTARAALGTGGVDHATHQALSRDYELLRDERDELAARLRAAEERLAALGRDADELTRRLDGAIARVERLMES